MTRMAQMKLETLAALELEEMPHEEDWSSDWHMRATLKDMAQELLAARRVVEAARDWRESCDECGDAPFEKRWAVTKTLKEYNNG